MSNGSEQKFQEADLTVVLSPDDCQIIKNYGDHFKITLPKGLQKALTIFEKDQSFTNQNEIKLQLCKWMVTSKHESYQDPIWNEPKIHANEIIYDLVFDEQVEELLNSIDETAAEQIITGMKDFSQQQVS